MHNETFDLFLRFTTKIPSLLETNKNSKLLLLHTSNCDQIILFRMFYIKSAELLFLSCHNANTSVLHIYFALDWNLPVVVTTFTSLSHTFLLLVP
jgi:hypothetical protein